MGSFSVLVGVGGGAATETATASTVVAIAFAVVVDAGSVGTISLTSPAMAESEESFKAS